MPGAPGPPALLDAGYWNIKCGLRRGEHTEIEDPVLLGTHQLLTIEQEEWLPCTIEQLEMGDAALLGNLADFGKTTPEGLPKRQPPRRGCRGIEQGYDNQIAELLGGTERQARGEGSE